MSTRAHVLIADGDTKLLFYRHSDGYPEVTGASLKKFVDGYRGKMRDNAMQSAGWLVVQGRDEMLESQREFAAKFGGAGRSGYDWKVGYYEPCASFYGDAEYIYLIDLKTSTLATIKGNTLQGQILEKYDFKAGGDQ